MVKRERCRGVSSVEFTNMLSLPAASRRLPRTYIAALPEARRTELERLRARLRQLAPNASETISYGMPALKLGDRFLLSYAGWKQHSSIYPMRDDVLERHAEVLRGYATTKGSLHFDEAHPLPDAVVEDLVRTRIAEVEAGGR